MLAVLCHPRIELLGPTSPPAKKLLTGVTDSFAGSTRAFERLRVSKLVKMLKKKVETNNKLDLVPLQQSSDSY